MTDSMAVTLSRPDRRQHALPGHPDWVKDAACTGNYSKVDGQDPFFDYGRNEKKIRAAKRICEGCPVRRECLAFNLNVPRGIFGGYTEAERQALQGKPRRRPSDAETYAFFRTYKAG